jgi:hypothetical protein
MVASQEGNFPPHALVNELIVDNRSGQQSWSSLRLFATLFLLLHVLGADHATLAKHIAILLAGNLFRHLKYHLDEGIHRQLRWSTKQQPGLAEIVDYTFKPRAGVVNSKAHRRIELQSPGARSPRWPLFSRMIPPHRRLRLAVFDTLSASHGRPVILVLGGAQQTDLVVVSVRTSARPGEFMGATPEHKNIHYFLRHDGYFRTLGAPEGSSSPEPAVLGKVTFVSSRRVNLGSKSASNRPARWKLLPDK